MHGRKKGVEGSYLCLSSAYVPSQGPFCSRKVRGDEGVGLCVFVKPVKLNITKNNIKLSTTIQRCGRRKAGGSG